ncbi:sugar ABC transporter permease [Paenibacillus pectinilyticus]|uniref:Sugar ABC transporter permease n=2 Tax=Paenibacillus pectinilyticus TaxID=512399 RepID=A0A1C1A824_9BACL|nr:ABC transporter permease subunit [Paenibacillus pectinilyticus]OCT16760.1 sugar ABC transporter permease [Paenibacillus pectinilyticus]
MMNDTPNTAAQAAPRHTAKRTRVKSTFLWTVRKYWIFYVMMAPAALLLIINNYIPMAGVLIAFKNVNYTKGIWASPWIGFDNFKYLFSSDVAWSITRNTISYNLVFIVLNLVIAVAMAIMFNEMRSKFLAKFHQSTMFLPFFLSMVCVAYLVYAFLGAEHGFVNTVLLPKLGIQPIDWYTEPKYWTVILPIVNTWKNLGYYTVIYMAAIIGIDHEYYEAALIDGANKWQQVKRITIPLIMPVMITMTLLQVGRIFYADFGLFFQVTKNAGALFPTTQVIDTYVYQTFLTMGDIGMSSAAGLYQAVVGFLLVLVTNLFVRKVSKENALF